MSKHTGIYKSAPCMWMRGGTSKGAYFLAADLPSDNEARAQFLLRVMGSPDERQIDGIGGADPLTSKVAVVQKSTRDDADVDYLFLQVFVDKAIVTDAQNCGNILAGIAPFAIERGLVTACEGETSVRIFMENTGQIAVARVLVKDGEVQYEGDARIDGVPGFSAAVPIVFQDTAGSSCGSLLPTGSVVDVIDGVEVTCIDNGMPVVIMRATDMGITGLESREELEANDLLRAKLESIRLQVGPMMNLGNVKDKSVPKMTMVSTSTNGGALSTRTFIPHRCHASIGVLGAVSVATAAVLKGSPANDVASYQASARMTLDVEHPIGAMTVILDQNDQGEVGSAAILRTARKLFDGQVFAHSNEL
ncbi:MULTISPECIES: 4-oxalomesaconate tautomerase [Marinomonas]|uniref:4-oxalomesaconate tautomerase n=3 Tax=Marinomonas TaxID=28253 RepID=A0A1M5MXM6_9GAMM|nr:MULTISPECIES: 4-oxalomesaconate tautomerase [Marinomonas]MBR7889864.1 4-oxalomesaconate tautomerase [Marinomonas vulgaris]RCW98288.1 4-oxalomesaconate tautomerase [Marinomonas foliarum]SHG82074.1 4-oxalomesaconate tautomerase [Marinomonas polaris DSM 16579]